MGEINKERARKTAFVLFCIGCAGCCVFLFVWFINGQLNKNKSRELANRFHTVASVEVGQSSNSQQSGEAPQQKIINIMDELYSENEDMTGWIHIKGTEIDFPVLLHPNNEYYLNRNFWKEEDKYGAIFMDCANTEGFLSSHTILYGHNMKDGAMFGGLPKYLNPDYLSANSIITITQMDGSNLRYRIFTAKKVYSDDLAYRTAFADENEFGAFAAALGSPDVSSPLLTLSTCTNGANDTERMLIHAVLVE